MSKKPALGRGFEGLIPTGFDVSNVAAPGESIKQLSLDVLVTNPDQPRKQFDETSLQELAESIKQHGIIQPLVVTPSGVKYRIVAGERRYRASQIAGLKKVPAIVRNHKELEELEISIVENVQRVDLSPLEQAVSIVRLRDQFSLSTKEIAQKLGKAEPTISNIVRLLQLPKEAVVALQENKITEGHARAILALKADEKMQRELLNTIITQNSTVRDAEEFVKKNRRYSNPKTKVSPTVSKLVAQLEPELAKNIKIQQRIDGTGVLQLRYSDPKELEHIINKLI